MICEEVKVTYDRKTGKILDNIFIGFKELKDSTENCVMKMLLDRMMEENIIPNPKRGA